MKILQVSRDFSMSGGVAKYLNRLVRALADTGHSVDVMRAASPDPAAWPAQPRGL